MAPKIGAIRRKYNFSWRSEAKAAAPGKLDSQGSEAEMWNVPVANGDACACHQRAVDRGQQAAEERVGGYEADGCSLGHGGPLFWLRSRFRFVDLGIIYVYQIPETIYLFA